MPGYGARCLEPIPTGLHHSAQGCEERATLERHSIRHSIPNHPTLKEWQAKGIRCASALHALHAVAKIDAAFRSITMHQRCNPRSLPSLMRASAVLPRGGSLNLGRSTRHDPIRRHECSPEVEAPSCPLAHHRCGVPRRLHRVVFARAVSRTQSGRPGQPRQLVAGVLRRAVHIARRSTEAAAHSIGLALSPADAG